MIANLKMLEVIAEKLGDLCEEVVFLGGASIALLITDLGAPDVRYTDDVDCIIDVISLNQYQKLEKKLRAKGFTQKQEVICRWCIEGITLDMMPTDKDILGFSNSWYKPAIRNSIQATLRNGLKINLVTAPYFLATKLEAFRSRGAGDFFASHDMEDLITVIDGRPEIVADIESSDLELRSHLTNEFASLIAERKFQDAVPGHLSSYPSSMQNTRAVIVWTRVKALAEMKKQ